MTTTQKKTIKVSDCKISTVTVYKMQAEITRKVDLGSLEAGKTIIQLKGLVDSIDLSVS